MAEPKDHLNVVGATEARNFKSMLSVVRDKFPPRDRITHGQRLLADLRQVRIRADDIAARRAALGIEPRLGLTIAIRIAPRGLFDFKNIEWKRDGIEVLNARPGDGFDLVVVHVPEGRLAAFEGRIQDYLDKTTRKGGPKNATLVNAIESFRSGAFDELWTEAADPPQDTQARWFQLWLRTGTRTPAITKQEFVEAAQGFEIEVEEGYVPFPGRIVVAVHATRQQLEQAVELLDMVAEIRGTQPHAEFFSADLTPIEQAQWVRNLEQRTEDHSHPDSAYVTLLDTGVAQGHPLITKSLHVADMFAANAAWPVTDNDGHGTQMAGLILYGNLVHPLASSDAFELHHRLESVQLYPPTGHTLPHLYGWVTDSATQVVEAANPGRRRSYAMMTTATGATTGSPSEWSATIDRLSFGSAGTLKREEEQVKRLFILSAGNVSPKLWASYPTINTTTTIESPAQAWNALTVGAHTEMTEIDAGKWPSLKCIAAEGALSPSSSTSMLWSRGWPFKPDVVAEGGNGSTDKFGAVVGPGSLRLLTTYHDMTVSPLVETGDTSAAAAEVARLCAHLTTRYPDYWPETIRALVIHGARYTPAMLQSLAKNPSGNDKEGLVRRVGYGAIRADNALNSTTHRPTLILQEKIVPYRKEGSDGRLNKVNMHRLPWPADELLALGGAELQMRVTLSYFIDPNPSQRGWQSKFRYQSHGLRFSVKAATETDEEFGQRINKIEREEAADGDELESMPDPDSGKWLLGSRIRSRGSVHSDVWNGTAAELANKSHLAVFPVGGWWKDWSQAERHGVEVRYCLIVSLEVSEEIAVDLYTPIQTQIVVPATPAVVDISIPTS